MQYLIVLVIIVIVTVYMVLNPKDKSKPEPDTETLRLIREFKANADGYVVDFDKCTFKDSSYMAEEEQDDNNISTLNVVASLAATFVALEPIDLSPGRRSVEIVNKVQSVLFYKDTEQFGNLRFIQTFPMDQATLKFHVVRGNVTLYIDKSDNKKFFFQIESQRNAS